VFPLCSKSRAYHRCSLCVVTSRPVLLKDQHKENVAYLALLCLLQRMRFRFADLRFEGNVRAVEVGRAQGVVTAARRYDAAPSLCTVCKPRSFCVNFLRLQISAPKSPFCCVSKTSFEFFFCIFLNYLPKALFPDFLLRLQTSALKSPFLLNFCDF
jgi:hypothetical protein